MALEEIQVRLRRQLQDMFGVEEASILMDRPPGGWNDLVTNQTLDLKIDVLRSELRGEMAALRGDLRSEMAALSASVDRRLRAQTWISTTTLIAGITLAAAVSRL
ncbi:MAG TPA: hypothetical protein VGA62_04480 [Acidimicrobiia bacterium]